MLGLAAVVFAATVLAAIGRAIRRRLAWPRSKDALPGRSLVVWLGLINLLFVVAFPVLASDRTALLDGSAAALKILLALPVLGALLAFWATTAVVRQWRSGAGTRAARLRHAAVIVLALSFTWSLSQWNLLGWRL